MFKCLYYSKFASSCTFFRVQKFGWNMMGFWLGEDEITRLQLIVLLVNCMEVLIYGVRTFSKQQFRSFCQIFQGWFIFVNRGNLVVVFDAITPFLTQIPTILRLLILVWYRNDLKYVLDYLKADFVNGKLIKDGKNDSKIISTSLKQLAVNLFSF